MRTTWWTVAVVIAGGVSGCGDGGSPSETARTDVDLLLSCPKTAQNGFDLDIPGPGRRTPQEAVAPFAQGMSTIVGETSNRTVVYALGPTDKVAKEFQLTRRDDGWWPDSYVECRD